MKFEVDSEVTTIYAYPGMPKYAKDPNAPSFDKVIVDDLNTWESSSESEDEVSDGWSTFISKKEKYAWTRKVSIPDELPSEKANWVGKLNKF